MQLVTGQTPIRGFEMISIDVLHATQASFLRPFSVPYQPVPPQIRSGYTSAAMQKRNLHYLDLIGFAFG